MTALAFATAAGILLVSAGLLQVIGHYDDGGRSTPVNWAALAVPALLVAVAPFAGWLAGTEGPQPDRNGVTLGDRVLWTQHAEQCRTDDVWAVVVDSEASVLPGGAVYRLQPTCAGVPVDSTVVVGAGGFVLLDGAT